MTAQVGTIRPLVSFHENYHESLADLEAIDQKRLNDAFLQFKSDPDHPSLNFHPVKGAQKGLMSVRASKELRVIVYRRGSTFMWLFADHHDRAYERAERMKVVIDPRESLTIVGAPLSFDRDDVVAGAGRSTGERTGSHEPTQVDEKRPLDHWTDSELESVGFDKTERQQLRALTSADQALELFDDGWTEERVDFVLEVIEQTPEQVLDPSLTADPEAEAEQRLRDAIERFGALAGLSPLFDPEELERIASAPIEDWMLFLHPDQRTLADRSYNGPARVRGAAGTGKTVVALHRTASLAKRLDPDEGGILVTTYINSLPPVLESLYERLPTARADRVEFINVDKLAYRICTEAGHRPNLDPQGVSAALAAAWKSVVTPDSPIDRAGLTRGYMSDELCKVIKGRGITDLDTYLDVRRTGRRTQFGAALRTQAWELHEAWNAAMAKRGVEDFHDVVLRARDVARQRSEPTYRAAVVDEAQDLTLVALQLIRSLVNGPGPDRPDGLFLSGDGAQRIYAGGFTLRQAGVEVRGRTTVLGINYRNTQQIYDAAIAVSGTDEIEDLDEDYHREDEPAQLRRSGAPVELLTAAGSDSECAWIVERIERILRDGDRVSPGDIAVCALTNRAAKAYRRALEPAGLSVQELKDYDGHPNEHVKVGTHHRIKGLEFKVVFVPGLSEGEFPRARSEGMDDTEYSDQVALQMSALFVAMTRARDRLVLSCVGSPSSVLAPVIDRLECHTA